MAVVWQKLSFTKLHVARVMCRNLRQKPINEKVLQCFQEVFDISVSQIMPILSKYPRLNLMKREQILESLNVLKKFNIDKTVALENPAVLAIKSHFLRNHGSILLECGFTEINPDYLITYHSLLKKSTIADLKRDGIIPSNLNVYENLLNCFTTLPQSKRFTGTYNEYSSLLEVRLSIMQKYLEYKLSISKEEFQKMYNTYFHFQHRPLVDIEQSIIIATEEIELPLKRILSYPYVVAVDPSNTRKILDNDMSFDGIDPRDMVRTNPGVIRSSYSSVLKITQILKKYKFPSSAWKKAGLIYTFKPETVEERLSEIKGNKIFEALSTNPRFLLVIMCKNKAQYRINRLQTANRKCVSLHSLVTSVDNFEHYLKELADKSSGNDIMQLFIELLLKSSKSKHEITQQFYNIREVISRNVYWTFVPTVSIVETMTMLKNNFSSEEILANCHLVLYSSEIIEKYLASIEHLQNLSVNESFLSQNVTESRSQNNFNNSLCNENLAKVSNDLSGFNVNLKNLNNTQTLALVLYCIEKDQFFSGEGIWNNKMLTSK